MRKRQRIAAAICAAVLPTGTVACGGSTDSGYPDAGRSGAAESSVEMVGPVTRSADELRGTTVELTVGRVLNIDTGDVPVQSYRGEVADRRVAKFERGRDEGGVRFNPGVTAVAPGTTAVTMTSEDADTEPIRFTVTVTAAE